MSNVFFTADTHWKHRNIIKYCDRPYSSVEEMDSALIANWNGRVKPNDIVYHLGDFALGSPESVVKALNGEIHLIWGNHDNSSNKKILRKYVASTQDYLEVPGFGPTPLVLFHYSLKIWNRSHHGALMLYGHSHGTLPGTSQSLDIGIDCWNYQPISIEEIRARMETLPKYRNPDHHNEKTHNE
jgi:calcineurin-like phosphoesterase family protein